MRRSFPRLAAGTRVLAALAGGYSLALLATLCLSQVAGSRAQGLSTGMTAFFAIWTGAMIWTFAAHSLPRALIGLAVPAFLLGTLYGWLTW